MESPDDNALLRQFAEDRSDEAFSQLVSRHVNLVYSVALRSVGNPHQAEEIVQAVFIILARKAAHLRREQNLAGWLFQTTRLTANNFIRSETRRQHREQEAYMESLLNETTEATAPQILPLLDAAVASLREADRQAILLRYYQGRNLAEVATALGASETAAERRVQRAVEKLRRFFLRRGVATPAAVIAATLAAGSTQAAPAGLAQSAAAVALAKGAAAGGSAVLLAQGTMKFAAWAKFKTALIIGVIALVASSTSILLLQVKFNRSREEQIRAEERQIREQEQNPALTPDERQKLETQLNQLKAEHDRLRAKQDQLWQQIETNRANGN